MTITPEEVAQFQEHGFVLLKGLMGQDQIMRLKSVARGAMEHAAPRVAFAELTFEGTAQTQARLHALSSAVRLSSLPQFPDRQPKAHCIMETNLWRREETIADFALDGALPEIAAALLGLEELRFYMDHLFVREPGIVDRMGFDRCFSHLEAGRGCVFTIALDSVQRGSGAVGYVPGSHRWGDEIPDIDADTNAFGIAYAEADLGDVIAHHFRTVRGSEGDGDSRTSRVFSFSYCEAELRHRDRPPGKLDEKQHPRVWPPGKVKTA